MRHRMNTRKLGRTSSHRVAMYRNLVSSLLEHEKVETTHAKAREVGRLAERMITLGKRGDLHARRQALRVVHGRSVTAKLFGELAQRFASRTGGYTRVLRTRRRIGDAAEMSIVQLVDPAQADTGGGKAEVKKSAGRRKATASKTGSKKSPSRKASGKEADGEKATGKKATSKKASPKKKPTSKADSD
jgi:large subunit ribosomal protein L17